MAMKELPKFIWAFVFAILIFSVGFVVVVKMQQTMSYGKTLYTLDTGLPINFKAMTTNASKSVSVTALEYKDIVGSAGIKALGNSSAILLDDIDRGFVSFANTTWTVSYYVKANVTNIATILCDVLLINATSGATIDTLGDDVAETSLIAGTDNQTKTATFAYSNTTYSFNPKDYYLKFIWACNKTDAKYSLKLYLGHASSKVTGLKYNKASAITYPLTILVFVLMAIAILVAILKYVSQKVKRR